MYCSVVYLIDQSTLRIFRAIVKQRNNNQISLKEKCDSFKYVFYSQEYLMLDNEIHVAPVRYNLYHGAFNTGLVRQC